MNAQKPQELIERINAETGAPAPYRLNEPMSLHTTFGVGGPADVWVRPDGAGFPEYAAALLKTARAEHIPVFILGGGANIVVSDAGVRGIVLDCGSNRGVIIEEKRDDGDPRAFPAGLTVDEAVEAAAALGLSGLEFLAGMPGTIGGAVWMNARCYERSVSDVLVETEIIDERFSRRWVPFNNEDFGYKKSPFQNRDVLILSARFCLGPGDPAAIRREMAAHRRDREAKGHYRLPSAGSVFKNNRAFGAPAGKIIDELGLRGFSVGGAQVAPWHGNIIVNTGGATAQDIRALLDAVREKVLAERGFCLEPEILFVGGRY
jgi:UDP-N-acetylmuramate dehydrogenase